MRRKNFVLPVALMMLAITQLQAGARRDSPSPEGGGGAVGVSAVFQLNPEIVLENNPVIQLLERDLNVRLDIEAPPQNGYGDRVKILVSTGSMPDLVHYGADIFATQWAQEKLILDLTDRIAAYPNLKANISAEQYGDCVFLPDGRIYGIPRPNSYDKWGFVINKKWLDKLGLEPPRTVAEFVEVCRAFTFNDPDGNGRDDTYGASLHAQQSSLDSGIWHLQNDFFSMAYSISSWHAGMPDSDGSARLRALKKQYPDYMRQLRALYQEGIIDREFITHNASENYEKIAQGRVGIVGASEKNYNTGILERYNMNLDDFIYCPPLVLDVSQKPVYAMPPSNWMAYYVNAGSSPAKQDAALRVLDWGNSEKGFIAMQMGIQGLHYNSYDIGGRVVNRTPAQAEALRRVTSNMLGFANAWRGEEALMGGSTSAQIAKWQAEAGAADAAAAKCYFGFTKMLDGIGTRFPDITSNLNSLEVRYITGEVPFDQLDAYIKTTFAPATSEIQNEFAAYMAANPARFVD
jgi:putative aldouronate transport system substrate-binding protein